MGKKKIALFYDEDTEKGRQILEFLMREMAKKAASREEILPFLRVCAANSNLSLLNQLLVYEQCPSAKTVCGKFAWKQLGRTVKEDAVPVQILLPDVSPEKAVGYLVVNVYDYISKKITNFLKFTLTKLKDFSTMKFIALSDISTLNIHIYKAKTRKNRKH